MANEQQKSNQPYPHDRIATLEAQVAAQSDQVNALMKLLAAQQPVLQPVALEQEREREFQERVKELGKSCLQRTQEFARSQWAKECPMEYPVSMPTNKEQLSLLIPARSSDEARGRYLTLCGIQAIDQDRRLEVGQPVQRQAA